MHRSVLSIDILSLFELLIKFVVLLLFYINLLLILSANNYLGLWVLIKTEIMVESFISYNLGKIGWRSLELGHDPSVEVSQGLP